MKKIGTGVVFATLIAGVVASYAGVEDNEVTFLFVQSALDVEINKNQITLKKVSPSTIYFSDRPSRIAGHMTTEKFMHIWESGGAESFEASNPNAALSIFNGDDSDTLIVVLSNPVLKRGNLTYDICTLSGTVPEKGGQCSLFIDVIGRPRSPGSIAGVARRSTARHVIVGSSIAHAETADAYEDAREAEARADKAEAEAAAAKAQAATPAAPAKHSPEEKMEQLNKMHEEGFIDDAEYEKKKQEILSSFWRGIVTPKPDFYFPKTGRSSKTPCCTQGIFFFADLIFPKQDGLQRIDKGNG
jgi:hypothetical protein